MGRRTEARREELNSPGRTINIESIPIAITIPAATNIEL
jgi:hypothetical protein